MHSLWYCPFNNSYCIQLQANYRNLVKDHVTERADHYKSPLLEISMESRNFLKCFFLSLFCVVSSLCCSYYVMLCGFFIMCCSRFIIRYVVSSWCLVMQSRRDVFLWWRCVITSLCGVALSWCIEVLPYSLCSCHDVMWLRCYVVWYRRYAVWSLRDVVSSLCLLSLTCDTKL